MKRLVQQLEWSLAVALVCGAGLMVQAQEVRVDAPGASVRVGPDRGADGARVEARGDVTVRAPGVDVDVDVDASGARRGRVVRIGPDRPVRVEADQIIVDAEPSYWVGILGGEISPELRAHLGPQVEDEETGVIVREVIPESPAAGAGLLQHDILLRANGVPITDMSVLVKEVRSVGPSKGQVTIELLRNGQRKTLWVKPVERPAAPAVNQPGFREDAPGPRPWIDWLGGRQGEPLRLRMFGAGPNIRVNTPGGVGVNVTSVNGKTRVVVKQGDKTWDIDASDPKMLEQLPPDIRGMVEGMLSGNGGVDINIDEMIPDLGGIFDRGFGGRRATLRQEMEDMRRQIEAMQRQLGVAPPAGDPALDEAPAFAPDQIGPVEVEIPAEAEVDAVEER